MQDPSASTTSLSSEPFYPRLLRTKPAKFPDESDFSQLGEAAESWELSPDKLTLTLKIRQGMKWDARPPTSGRLLDANDVVFSWNKFKAVNAGATRPSPTTPRLPPEVPIESMTATDDKTVVMKLHAPYASILPLQTARDLLYIGPKESDGGFDPRKDVRGHGPFTLEEYVPSSRFVWKKNPDYYLKDRPFVDRVEVPIVTDQAQRAAQFRAGNIHTDVMRREPEQRSSACKQQLPDTLLIQEPIATTASPSPVLTFGWEQASVFRDQRLRQALSMMVDRDAYADVIENRADFRKNGIELAGEDQHGACRRGWGDYYLDPSDIKEFGPNAQYLSLNLAEAKKHARRRGSSRTASNSTSASRRAGTVLSTRRQVAAPRRASSPMAA